MKSFTWDYLVNIVARSVNNSICLRREAPNEYLSLECFPDATNEEIRDFILENPYFDEELRNFLLGNTRELEFVFNQSGEDDFIEKCDKWATDDGWLKEMNSSNIDFQEFDDEDLILPF